MGIFEQFPYTNFHDLNLDWILRATQSMDKKLNEFVASNVLSYADPIQWDIETQYAKNTVVVDPKTGTAYMSINPVPVGQLLTNKYYWQPIFNYDEIVNTLKKQIAAVQADQHDTIPVAVGLGGLVWVVNKLYRLTKSLDAGSKIIENENAVPVTVEEIINDIDARLIKEISDRESADTTITNNLNKEISDRESADTTITNNLNKEISDRSDLISKDSSGNTVVTSTNGALDINTKNPIKYSTPQILNNYFKYIPATDRNGNNYKILVDNGAMFGADFFSGIVIGCGDSIAWGYPYTMNDGTLNKIAEKTGKTLNTDFYNVSFSAEGFTNIDSRMNFKERLQQLETVINDKNNVTGIIVVGGTNDFSSGATPESFNTAVTDFITYAHATYPYAKIAIVSDFMSSTDKNGIIQMSRYLHALQLINYPACHIANLGVALKKWYLYSNDTQYDDIHPNKTGYDMAASFIISKIIGGETLDYTYANIDTFNVWDSCYEFNGDYFRYMLYGGRLFTKSNGFTNTGGNNPGFMGYINNIKLKIRTLAVGGDEGQAWVKSSPQYGFVSFVTTDNWNGIFAPSLIRFVLGANGRLYIDVTGINTKDPGTGFISSNEIKEMYCIPFLEGNLNHVTLLTS